MCKHTIVTEYTQLIHTQTNPQQLWYEDKTSINISISINIRISISILPDNCIQCHLWWQQGCTGGWSAMLVCLLLQ